MRMKFNFPTDCFRLSTHNKNTLWLATLYHIISTIPLFLMGVLFFIYTHFFRSTIRVQNKGLVLVMYIFITSVIKDKITKQQVDLYSQAIFRPNRIQ